MEAVSLGQLLSSFDSYVDARFVVVVIFGHYH